MNKTKIIIWILAIILLVNFVNAKVYFSESFNYPDGALAQALNWTGTATISTKAALLDSNGEYLASKNFTKNNATYIHMNITASTATFFNWILTESDCSYVTYLRWNSDGKIKYCDGTCKDLTPAAPYSNNVKQHYKLYLDKSAHTFKLELNNTNYTGNFFSAAQDDFTSFYSDQNTNAQPVYVDNVCVADNEGDCINIFLPLYNASQTTLTDFNFTQNGWNDTVNLSKVFTDEDKGSLNFSYWINDTTNFLVTINNVTGMINISSKVQDWVGDAVINITAYDGFNYSINSTQFDVGVTKINDLNKGLVSVWITNSSSVNNTEVFDQVGTNHMTLQLGATCNAGSQVIGTNTVGCALDGNNDLINKSVLNMRTNGGFSVSGWYQSNQNQAAGTYKILWRWDDQLGNAYFATYAYEDYDNYAYFATSNNQSSTNHINKYTTALGTTLHHYVWTCNDSSSTKLYIDGVLVSTNLSKNTACTNTLNSYPFTIGSKMANLGTGETFNGNMSHVYLYNRTLKASEVLLLNSSTTGLYPFPDTSSNSAPVYNSSQVAITDINMSEDGWNDTADLIPSVGNVFSDANGNALTKFEYNINDSTHFTVRINNATGLLNVTPVANWSGDARINFSAFDGTDWSDNSSWIDVGVLGVNDVPSVLWDLLEYGNGSHQNAANLTFFFNVTDVDGDADVEYCELYQNGTIKDNRTSVVKNDPTYSLGYLTSANEIGDYVWNLSCYDLASSYWSGLKEVFVDKVSPIISWNYPSNFNNTIIKNATNIVLNVSISDNYLFSGELLINKTGTNTRVWNDSFFNWSDLHGGTQYNWSNTTNSSSWDEGNYTITVDGYDSHTYKPVNDLKVKLENNKSCNIISCDVLPEDLPNKKIKENKADIYYVIGYNDTLTGELFSVAIEGKNKEVLSDFNVSVDLINDTEFKMTYRFTIPSANFRLKQILNASDIIKTTTDIPGHFVINRKYYMDSKDVVDAGFNFSVEHTSNQGYEMEIWNESWLPGDIVEIDPAVGGLNRVTEQIIFRIDNPPKYNASQVHLTDFNFSEDLTNSSVNLSKVFYDDDGDNLNFTYIVNDTTHFKVVINNATGIINISSKIGNWSGDGLINITAFDGTEWSVNSTQFDIGILAVNDAPSYNASQDTISSITFSEDSWNDTVNVSKLWYDAENSAMSAFEWQINDTTHFTIKLINTTGMLNVSSVANWSGTALINFSAKDGALWTTANSSQFNINVAAVNDRPYFNFSQLEAFNFTFNEDSWNDSVNLSRLFVDVDFLITNFSDLNFSYMMSSNSNITVRINNLTDKVNISSLANATGKATINFSAWDGLLNSYNYSINFNISIKNVNDGPDINKSNITRMDFYSLTNIWANVTDIEGGSISEVNFTVWYPNSSIAVARHNGMFTSPFWNSSSFNLTEGGVWMVAINASDAGGATTNIAWNFTMNITHLNIVDWLVSDNGLGNVINITANVSVDSPIVWCNYSFNKPDGTVLVNNSVGNVSKKFFDYEEWTHSVRLLQNGTYSGNVTCFSEDGYSDSYNAIMFTVKDDWLLSPTTYLDSLQSANVDVLFNISFRPSSVVNFSYDFNVTSDYLTENFTVSINDVVNSTQMNLTNSTIWKIPVNLSVKNLTNGTYYFNITLFRINASYHRNETIGITIGAYPPAGNVVLLNESVGYQCNGLYCDKSSSLSGTEEASFSWFLNNTGSFNMTNCSVGFDNTLAGINGSASLNNFELNVSDVKNLTFSWSNIPVGTLDGFLNVTCVADGFGSKDSLITSQRPYVRLFKSSSSVGGSAGGGGGGGGYVAQNMSVMSAVDLENIVGNYTIDDGRCDDLVGESFFVSEDCRFTIKTLLCTSEMNDGCLWRQELWLFTIFGISTVTVLIVSFFRMGGKDGREVE